jgi:epoxyqueuosine reductase
MTAAKEHFKRAKREAVLAAAREAGFDAAGIAPAGPSPFRAALERWVADGWAGEMRWMETDPASRADPRALLPGARSVVVVALSYHRRWPPPPDGAGIVARYARARDYHGRARPLLRRLARGIEAIGGEGTACRIALDVEPLLERDLAARAGVAWWGKSAMAVHPRLGQWFLLGEVLTTLELEPDAPLADRCGKCARCVAACPTGAIVAPYRLDARRCLSYLGIEHRGKIPAELCAAMGNRLFGCDDCLEACPWNRFAREGALFARWARDDLAAVDPRALLALDGAGFRARFAGTPLARAGPERLQRNACVVLGNSGSAGDAPLLRAVAAAHASATVRAHAARAAAAIGERLAEKRV